MTARVAARVFAEVFETLAEELHAARTVEQGVAVEAVARRLWGMSREWYFEPEDMDIDGVLIDLRLARKVDGRVVYGPTKCGDMRYTLRGNETCWLAVGHEGECRYEEHDCADCGTRHGTCRNCGATHGDSHGETCKWSKPWMQALP